MGAAPSMRNQRQSAALYLENQVVDFDHPEQRGELFALDGQVGIFLLPSRILNTNCLPPAKVCLSFNLPTDKNRSLPKLVKAKAMKTTS